MKAITHVIIVIGRVFCFKDTKNQILQINLSNSYLNIIVNHSLVRALSGHSWDTYELHTFSNDQSTDSTFYNLAILKQNLSDNLLAIFNKTSHNGKSSVAATLGHIF